MHRPKTLRYQSHFKNIVNVVCYMLLNIYLLTYLLTYSHCCLVIEDVSNFQNVYRKSFFCF